MPPSTHPSSSSFPGSSVPSTVNRIFHQSFPAVGKYQNTIPSIGSHHPGQHIPVYRGPSDESNWVIPGLLLASASPAHSHDPELRTLRSILRLGIKTFVCLQQEYRHTGVTEMEWRTGQKPRPYFHEAQRIHAQQQYAFNRHQYHLALYNSPNLHASPTPTAPSSSSPLSFVHFPIVDVSVHPDDGAVLQQCYSLCERLLTKEPMVVHCHGGHGRTGIVVSIMLGILYNLDAETAMNWVQATHDTRVYTLNCPSPQTMEQREQVTRALALHYALMEQQKEQNNHQSSKIIIDTLPLTNTNSNNNAQDPTALSPIHTPTKDRMDEKEEMKNTTMMMMVVDNDTPIQFTTPNPSLVDTPMDNLTDQVKNLELNDNSTTISTPTTVSVDTPIETSSSSTVSPHDPARTVNHHVTSNRQHKQHHRRSPHKARNYAARANNNYPYYTSSSSSLSLSSSSSSPLGLNSTNNTIVIMKKSNGNNGGNAIVNPFGYANIDTENKEEMNTMLVPTKSSTSVSSPALNFFQALMFQKAQASYLSGGPTTTATNNTTTATVSAEC